MQFTMMSIVFALVAGQQVMADDFAKFFNSQSPYDRQSNQELTKTEDGVKSDINHSINNDGCFRYNDKTYMQTGISTDMLKTRCFVMSKDDNCNCQSDSYTFVANERMLLFHVTQCNANTYLAWTFNIDPAYRSFRFIEEGCGDNNCPQVTCTEVDLISAMEKSWKIIRWVVVVHM